MSKQHLIWEVYDNYRTARLNAKYYGARLVLFERLNTGSEIAMAVTAPGSVISGFWFLKTDTGLALWQIIAGCTAIIGLVKPFFRLTHRIKMYEQTLSGYRALEHDIYDVILQIMNDDGYSPAVKKMFEAARKKLKNLVTSSPEQKVDQKLVEKLTNEVIAELPTKSFYFPEEK
jgi:hypothetical protein